MIGPKANRILDVLHQTTVAVLIVSTCYFGFEAVRATMAIQKYKYEQKVGLRLPFVLMIAPLLHDCY